MFFKKKCKLSIIYDEKQDRIFFESSGGFTTAMLAIAFETLLSENPEVIEILETLYSKKERTIH